MKNVIPIFFACNDAYAPFLSCALISLQENSSPDYFYKIHILSSDITNENKSKIKKHIASNVSIEFISLKDKLKSFQGMFHTRDYYSKETYYRFFIANLFPEYDKVLYLDADMIFLGDVAELYNTDMSHYLLAAVHEDVMANKTFADYVELCLGVPHTNYFNAGTLVINTAKFREQHIEEKFIHLLRQFTFTLAQDQDYLNILCLGQVFYLDPGWNKSNLPAIGYQPEHLKIIHFKLNNKPWHYDGIDNENYFWEYANKSPFYTQIRTIKNNYSEKQKARDKMDSQRMLDVAIRDAEDPANYWNYMTMGAERYKIVKGINKYIRKPIKNINKLRKSIINKTHKAVYGK